MNKVTHRLGYPRPPHDGNDGYWRKLNELAHLIKKQLTLIRHSIDSQKPTATSSNISLESPTVWIAQPTEDLQTEWDSLFASISQRGATVLPVGHSTYPLSSIEDFRLAVQKDLSSSNLLIQLLNATAGRSIANGPANIVSLQALLAKTHCETTTGISLLQWRPADIDLTSIRNEKHRELLRGTIASGFSQFTRQVLESLDALMNPPLTQQDENINVYDDSLSICVTAGPKDSALADHVATIIGSLGHVPILVPPAPECDQSPQDYRSQLKSLLYDVDGVILAHSQQSDMWLPSQYAQLRKLLKNVRQTG